MIALTLLTITAGLLTGYLGQARMLVASSAGVLVASLVAIGPAHSWVALAGLVVLNVGIFEVTAVCAMVYFNASASRQRRKRELDSRPTLRS